MIKKYSKEFKSEAVRLVEESGLKSKEVCTELGVSLSALDKWVREHRRSTESKELKVEEKAELIKLREENRRLKLEKELLKKATIYFAKNSESGAC